MAPILYQLDFTTTLVKPEELLPASSASIIHSCLSVDSISYYRRRQNLFNAVKKNSVISLWLQLRFVHLSLCIIC